MDKRLQKALNKAVQQKQAKQRVSANVSSEAKKEHDKFIKKWMPKARAWIDEKLFPQIVEAESNSKHYILLGRYEDSIPSEVIYEAAKKVSGLKASVKTAQSYDHIFGDPTIITYVIEWDSTDPNDHRNDR